MRHNAHRSWHDGTSETHINSKQKQTQHAQTNHMNKRSFIVFVQLFSPPSYQGFSWPTRPISSKLPGEWMDNASVASICYRPTSPPRKRPANSATCFLSYSCLTNGRILQLNHVGKKIVPKYYFFLGEIYINSLKINGWKTAYVLRRPIFRRELLCLLTVITYEPGIIAKTSLGTDLKMHLFHR